MPTKNLWKGALLGTLALPLVAFSQNVGGSTSDTSPSNMPSDTKPSDQMEPSDQTGIQSDTGKTGAMGDMGSTKEISGTISKVGSKEVWLNAEDGQKMTLHVDSSTKVYKPTGATEKISELKEGQQVRASYDTKKDQMHALRIDVISDTGTKPMDKNMNKPGDMGTQPNP